MFTKYGEGKGEGGSNLSWTPIGVYCNDENDKSFKGTFDGNEHVIDVYINKFAYSQCLFAYIGEGGTVKNLGINGEITGGSCVGGVAACNYGTIEECYNTAIISGSDPVYGGVVAYNYGIIDNCYNIATVSAMNTVGGIAAENQGEIKFCYNAATISSDGSMAGGVVGNNSGTVTNCYNTGAVNASTLGASIGGVVGNCYKGTVENCYNTGKVSGGFQVGGVVGDLTQGKVKNCYNTGIVSGTYYEIGGVVGSNDESTVENCYNTGAVSGTNYIGGAVGNNQGTVTNCYYLDTAYSTGIGLVKDGGSGTATSLTREQFKDQSKFSGFDFTNAWVMDDVFLGRPIFKAIPEITIKGNGKTAETAFEIPDLATLEAFRDSVNNGNDFSGQFVKLTADIDMSTKYGEGKGEGGSDLSWTPIGVHEKKYDFDTEMVVDTANARPFKGTFDGNEHVIDVYINATGGQGLFAYVAEGGTVKNLGIDGEISSTGSVAGIAAYNYGIIKDCYNAATISGTGNCVGGVVFKNQGTVEGCYNIGTLIADAKYGECTNVIGGVVCFNFDGMVRNCYNSGIFNINDNMYYAGGVVGSNDGGTIEGCYNSSTISCAAHSGGIVGSNYEGLIKDCYNTGTVSVTGRYSIAGGIISVNQPNGTVENCYNTGAVSGTGSIGGVVGENQGTVTNCYYLDTGSPGIGSTYNNGTGTATAKSAAEFASGEVAYLLQGTQTEQAWGQVLTGENKDSEPVLTSDSSKRVCKVSLLNVDGSAYKALYANYNGTVTLPTEPTVDSGFKFDGWLVDGTETKFTATTAVTQDITLKAQQVRNVFNVTYKDGKGGIIFADQSDSINSGESTPAFKGDLTNVTSYVFDGWDKTIASTVTEDVVYTAKWRNKAANKLILNGNGGTVGTSSTAESTTDEKSLAIGENTFVREGYHFTGWNTLANGKGTAYNSGDLVNFTAIHNAETVTLYAQWEVNSDYEISFNYGAEFGLSRKGNVKWTDKVLDGITEPKRNGYSFDGWFYNNKKVMENTTYAELAVNDTVKSIALIAKWTDTENPSILGIENGKTYCSAQTVTVTDNGIIKSVTVNGNGVDLDGNGKFTLNPTAGEQEIIVTDTDGNTATMTVTVNDGHTGGTATCCDKAVCDYCGEKYGDVDSSNHVGGTEVRNAKDAKCTEDGYTGDTYCKGCDAKLQDGKPITKLGHTDANKDHICDVESCKATISACSGGEATCCEKAVCDYCGKHYGDLNSENHTGEKVWTADDENHEQKWDCCGETVVKKEEHDYKWGICEECGHEHTNRISFIFQSIFVNVTSFTVKLFTGLVNFLKELNVFNFPCLR